VALASSWRRRRALARRALQGEMACDAVQPGGESFRPAQASSLARENEEDGLESILRLGSAIEHAPAHAQHHRAVSPHEFGERALIAMMNEASQQFAIANRLRQWGQGMNVP
jgi:hypothetical protein